MYHAPDGRTQDTVNNSVNTRTQTRNPTMIKSLRNKPLRMVAIAVLPLALLGTACGSDDDGDSPADTESDAPADTEAVRRTERGDESGEATRMSRRSARRSTSSSPRWTKCSPTPRAVTWRTITAQGQDLASAATDLAGSVDGDDTERLQECTEKLSIIGS